jgi:hypothetical protein
MGVGLISAVNTSAPAPRPYTADPAYTTDLAYTAGESAFGRATLNGQSYSEFKTEYNRSMSPPPATGPRSPGSARGTSPSRRRSKNAKGGMGGTWNDRIERDSTAIPAPKRRPTVALGGGQGHHSGSQLQQDWLGQQQALAEERKGNYDKLKGQRQEKERLGLEAAATARNRKLAAEGGGPPRSVAQKRREKADAEWYDRARAEMAEVAPPSSSGGGSGSQGQGQGQGGDDDDDDAAAGQDKKSAALGLVQVRLMRKQQLEREQENAVGKRQLLQIPVACIRAVPLQTRDVYGARTHINNHSKTSISIPAGLVRDDGSHADVVVGISSAQRAQRGMQATWDATGGGGGVYDMTARRAGGVGPGGGGSMSPPSLPSLGGGGGSFGGGGYTGARDSLAGTGAAAAAGADADAMFAGGVDGGGSTAGMPSMGFSGVGSRGFGATEYVYDSAGMDIDADLEANMEIDHHRGRPVKASISNPHALLPASASATAAGAVSQCCSAPLLGSAQAGASGSELEAQQEYRYSSRAHRLAGRDAVLGGGADTRPEMLELLHSLNQQQAAPAALGGRCGPGPGGQSVGPGAPALGGSINSSGRAVSRQSLHFTGGGAGFGSKVTMRSHTSRHGLPMHFESPLQSIADGVGVGCGGPEEEAAPAEEWRWAEETGGGSAGGGSGYAQGRQTQSAPRLRTAPQDRARGWLDRRADSRSSRQGGASGTADGGGSIGDGVHGDGFQRGGGLPLSRDRSRGQLHADAVDAEADAFARSASRGHSLAEEQAYALQLARHAHSLRRSGRLARAPSVSHSAQTHAVLGSPATLAHAGVRVGSCSAKPYHSAHFLAGVSKPGVCPVGCGPSRSHWASQAESGRKKMVRERGLTGTYPSLY